MSEIQLASVARSSLRDPIVKKFVDDVANLMKLEMVQAVSAQARPASFRGEFKPLSVGVRRTKQYASVGGVTTAWLGKKPAAERERIHRSFGTALASAPELKLLRRELGLDMTSSYVLDQVKHQIPARFSYVNQSFADRLSLSVPQLLDGVRIRVLPGRPVHGGTVGATDGGAGTGTAVLNKGLKLELEQVKCIDETDPEWFGKDEIELGGAAVDDKEDVTTIQQFKVGSFDDGDVRNFDPQRKLAEFSLAGEYPKTFAGFIGIAETDAGGFSDFLKELYDAIKAETTVILMALGAAAGAAIGAAIGGTVGTAVGGPIGTIIGVVAGLILGALVGFLINVAKDDLFEPQVATITLPTSDATFGGGSLVSPSMSFVYEDHGGMYRVQYRWRIVR